MKVSIQMKTRIKKMITFFMAILLIVLISGESKVYAAESYQLVTQVDIYQDSYSAANRSNPVGTYSAGSYTIYLRANGMINVSQQIGTPGGWINPADNQRKEPSIPTPNPTKLFKITSASRGLNMRSGPGISNSVIAKIPYETIVEVLDLGSSWSQISYGDQLGFVSNRYLGDVPPSSDEENNSYSVTARVNFRSGPSTAYESYGLLSVGTEVTVLAKTNNWFQVEYQGRMGYIHSNYLKEKTNPSPEPSDPIPDDSTYLVSKRVNFRSGPSTAYESYGLLPVGTKVFVKSTAGSWYQVEYQGRTGYIHSNYLKKNNEEPAKPTPPEKETITYIAEKRVNFRKGPSTSDRILGKILPGVEVERVESSGSWSKIIHNGVTGFVASSYIKKRSPGKPRIGITWFGSYKSYQRYYDAITSAGGEAIFLPHVSSLSEAKTALQNVDGLVSIGGGDLHPSFYGEEITDFTENLDEARDVSDYWILRGAFDENKPLLGICRGLQWINVLYGGTLYQDIPTQLGTGVIHRDPNKRVNVYHDITIKKDTKLAEMIGSGVQNVNSWHHQGIKKLGDHLIVSATAEDGLVEGIEAKDKKFVVGVQFHPEKLYTSQDKKYLNLFKGLVEESKKRS